MATVYFDGIDNNVSPQRVLPRYEDNAITEVRGQITYIKMKGSPKLPLKKAFQKRYLGLLLIQEVIPWVNAQFTSQITDIRVTSIKVYLGGSLSKCNIKVR
ncbi:MAG: hypothetical protein WC238_04565 [Parcubacteria group bacterium]